MYVHCMKIATVLRYCPMECNTEMKLIFISHEGLYFFFYTGIAGTTIPNPVFELDDRARYDIKSVSL